ncbi:hypothetical protein WEN_02260 [Mycoplasma wenyonii str. Massachusetts]|uniref:Uncharacterized protein n=1 Tax=Mycoplasma wenyonii (strain Massachusetts) TaxID=1197325 RepID=I6YLS3_MYCWM|nr:hypothetical protein [Mycoplasma wenyonii]AFN65239.1 hypothetical protein WEN_02260 [Mycoplasma wenyonii str. Massachusetts]
MTLAVKVLGIGLAGVATVAVGTTSYLLFSPSPTSLKTTEDFKKHCYKLTEFTKDNSNGSQFQLLACQADTKTDSVSFYLYQKGTAGASNTNDSFEEVKSVATSSTSSSQVTVHLFKEDSTNSGGQQLNIHGVGWNEIGWKPDSKLDNATLKNICKVNWSSSDREKKLNCQSSGGNVEHNISQEKKFNI